MAINKVEGWIMQKLHYRIAKLLAQSLLIVCALPSLGRSNGMTVDECPKIILTVMCDSDKEKPCCPTYIAEVAGQWGTNVRTLRFEWSLSSGKIISGQGTSTIRFDTRRSRRRTILVRVKVHGLHNWPAVCSKEIFQTSDRCRDTRRSATT